MEQHEQTRAEERAVRHLEARPTPKQVYALAHELAKRAGEEFPRTRGAASDLIQRLRKQNEEAVV
jgi:hypothetical protein